MPQRLDRHPSHERQQQQFEALQCLGDTALACMVPLVLRAQEGREWESCVYRPGSAHRQRACFGPKAPSAERANTMLQRTCVGANTAGRACFRQGRAFCACKEP